MNQELDLKIEKVMNWHYNVTPFIKALQVDQFLFKRAKEQSSGYIENESDLVDNILQSEYYLNKAKEKHFKKFQNKK